MISYGKDVNTYPAYKYLINFMKEAESAVYGNDGQKLSQYVDIESFAKVWLVKEYMADVDAVNNMHFWKESDINGDGKLHAGLTWDFDCTMERDSSSVSNANYKSVVYNEDGSAKWLAQLMNHRVFRDEILKQYDLHKDIYTNVTENGAKTSPLHKFAVQMASTYNTSLKMDTVRWSGTEDFSKVLNFSDTDRTKSLEVVKGFILKRNDYMETKRMPELVQMNLDDSSPSETVAPTEAPTQPPTDTPATTDMPTPTEAPTPIETPTSTAIPSVTQKPPGTSVENDVNKLQVGDKLKDKAGNAIYQVKSIKNGYVTVSYFKTIKTKTKVIKIDGTIYLKNGTKAKVTTISKNAFKYCKKLKKIVIGKNIKPKSVNANAFRGINKKVIIKVPKKNLKEYKKIFRGSGLKFT